MPTPVCRVALALLLGFALWSVVIPLEARAGIDFLPSAPQKAPQRPIYMVAGDLNQDGRDDLFVVSPASKALTVFLATGEPGAEIGKGVQYDLDSDNVKAPALGDINNDGVLDVVVPVVTEGKIRLFYGSTDGTLTRAVPDAGGYASPTAVAIANVALISPGDLLVTERGGGVKLAKNSSGRFLTPRTPCQGGCTTGPRPDQIWALDLNRDDRPDFVTLDVGGGREKSISVALGVAAAPGTDLYFQHPVPYVLGELPESPIFADVNRDGNPDLLALTVPRVSATESAVTTLFGLSDGTFSEPSSFIVECPYFVGDASCRGSALASGDFDGDGDVDLAVALNDPRTDGAQVRDALLILVGLGNGEFSPGPVFPIGDGVLQLVSGDIGGDGLTDLAASIGSTASVQALINRSTAGNLGNGEQCRFGDQCASSRCVDGLCCATACLAGERCNVPGREGVCVPLPVEPMKCTSPSQCATNFCVDGYCCESACSEGRCDLDGFEGVCIKSLANGEPCEEDKQCASQICSVNDVCCNERCTGGFCDERGICGPRRDLGDECNVDEACKSDICDVYNGICCAERCDPVEEDCNPEGQCVRLDATPTPTRTPRPTPGANGETCSVAGDCASTFCVNDICCEVSACGANEHCAAGTGQCAAGGTPTPTATATPPSPCDPNPCLDGEQCVVGGDNSALCVKTSSSGGCSTTGSGGSGNLLVAAAMPLLLWLGRRWRLQRAVARSRRHR